MSNSPRLSVQTQAGPSSSGSIGRRPQGARRRVAQGLYIANPDNSDDEGGSPNSLGGARRSSPVRVSPIASPSSGSLGRVPSVTSISIQGDSNSPRSSNPLPPIPSIPAPQSSPLPYASSMPNAPPIPPIPHSPCPLPQPPPQPERHLKRAQTTPMPEHRPTHESRPSLGSFPFAPVSSSPTRALPPLPSPPINPASSSSPGTSSPSIPSSAPPAPQPYPPPTPSSVHSMPEYLMTQPRMSSPEATLSPTPTTYGDGSKSLGSVEMGNRTRSGSVQSNKVRVQVTTDNESFTTVDITGMQTAEGIKERVFSKLRFRDDEYPNLSLFRTDVDEQPDSTAVTSDALIHLCSKMGDAKATLKFFVMHTTPTLAGAIIVPPMVDLPRITTGNLKAPVRTPSHHSRDGSMSSASEMFERQGTGTSTSDWSEIQPEELEGSVQRATKRNVRMGQRLTSDGGHSPSATSPNRMKAPSPPPPRGNVTPTPPRNSEPGPSVAGPSSRLGLRTDDGMDAETRALIAQLQKEEVDANAARMRQLEADEEYARREQQSERSIWEAMQELELEKQRRRRAQIEQDEIRARQVEAEDRRMEDEAAAQLAARAAWDAEQREAVQEREREQAGTWNARTATFAEERRQRAAHYRSQAQMGPGAIRESSFDSHTLPALGVGGSGGRRPSDSHYEASRQPQYTPGTPTYDQAVYTAPPAQYKSQVPSHGMSYDAQDQRFMQMNSHSHPGQRMVNDGMTRRQESRGGPPLGRDSEILHAPPLQNTRSMDSLRLYSPQAPVSRPPYQGVPPRTALTPGPGASGQMYRSPSGDLPQDGRYPEPSRPKPLQLDGMDGVGFVPFPTAHPRGSDGEWTYQESSPLSSARRSPYGRTPSPRPQSNYEQSSSPHTATLPRRPSTLYDEQDPGRTARVEAYAPDYGSWSQRPQSSPASAVSNPRTPSPLDHRRATDDGGQDSTLLPYAGAPDQSWLSVPRSSRRDIGDMADTMSIAGTVSSQATTIRPGRGSGDEEDDSADTARAGDWSSQLMSMIERGDAHSLRQPMRPVDDDDDDEATLFIAGPRSDSPKSRPLRPWSSRPNLYRINTTADVAPGLVDSATASDSATESESEGRIHRAKSFRPPKDNPEQWHVRPEPEALYENLDNYFPKIDLDKPIVEGGLSTPTTPASESPRPVDVAPPPVPPVRQASQNTSSSASPKPEDTVRPLPPPQHPARGAFNKAENRKSIRVMADYKRKTMLRHDDKKDKPKDDEKPKRRFSMWGHRIQEVTPSKMQNGQIPTAIPESPVADGKPKTLNWVKGELIGKGSYGRVYIAMNVTTGDMMAVKQVELPATERDRHDRRQMGMIDALDSEIALLKDMYHPNIVAYLGCETSPEYLSIFLEYVPGGTIASIYRTPNQARFEEQLVKFFTKQILEGLAYLHGRNIWHRDLKGDNILVDAAGVCKISDFGISKQTNDAYDSFGNATVMKGSVFWMAPEVIHSPEEKSYSGKVDIWSLGCVVLEMWTGRRPWGDLEQVAAMFELFNKRARPPLPPDVHLSQVALDFMNERCLATDPSNRPVARDLLQHPFITDVDRSWTFAGSHIGKAVAKRAPKTIRTV